MATVYSVDEELRWLQRIIGPVTTKIIAEIYRQNETNMHDIFSVKNAFKWIQFFMAANSAMLSLILLHGPVGERFEEFAL